ncbi:hypothetical protein [Siminovitchia fortis]|uniref:hypothetical protein n=1 Tax=Siminovitchia fortis TaxID=254758 RepID=UPI0011A06C27|nr:hypothetical protein [Siminovitchia fortis]
MEVWIVMITVYELVFYLLTKWHILLLSLQLIGSIAFFIWLRKKSAESVWSIQILVLYLCFLGLIHSLAGNLFSVPMATYTAGSFMISWAAWKGSRKY